MYVWSQEDGDASKDGKSGGGVFSSFGGSLSNAAAMMDDMAWAKDAEPIVDTHLGEGSSAFRYVLPWLRH